jgi:hypothetical protein
MIVGTGISKNIDGKGKIFLLLLSTVGIVLVTVGTLGLSVASATATGPAIQDPGEISAMMTQASENIRNELQSQGEKLGNQLSTTFGFNEIQSQLSLGYQFAFSGNTSGAISHVKMADNALESTISSVFRTAEEITRISQNNSLTLDNGTRQILMAVGGSLSDLGGEIREQRTNLIGMLE